MLLKSRLALIGAVSVTALVLSPSAPAVAHDGGHDLIRSTFTPSHPGDAAINGVSPGALPWVLGRGEVRVRANGRMDVRIEGLQIPFPAPDVTRNPVANIHAVLYCSGAAAADSGSHPMSVPGGDSRFRVSLAVPQSCADAVVLIQPDNAQAPGTRANAYIASAVAMGDDED